MPNISPIYRSCEIYVGHAQRGWGHGQRTQFPLLALCTLHLRALSRMLLPADETVLQPVMMPISCQGNICVCFMSSVLLPFMCFGVESFLERKKSHTTQCLHGHLAG